MKGKRKMKNILNSLRHLTTEAFRRKPKLTIITIIILAIVAYFNVNNFLNRPVVSTSGAKTVTFSVSGIYNEGVDIKSGHYYVVNKATQEKGYSSIDINLKNGKNWQSDSYMDSTIKMSVPKGATIELGLRDSEVTFYTKSDYDKIKDELEKATSSYSSSSESTSTSSSESAPSSSSSTSASSSTIETTADDFYAKMNSSTLETGKTYKFTGKAADKNLWGESGDDDYTIYVSAYDSNKGKDDVITLDTTKSIYETLKNATEFEVTVRVTEDTEFDDYDLNIVTATPK